MYAFPLGSGSTYRSNAENQRIRLATESEEITMLPNHLYSQPPSTTGATDVNSLYPISDGAPPGTAFANQAIPTRGVGTHFRAISYKERLGIISDTKG
jgi:hypothetical protein